MRETKPALLPTGRHGRNVIIAGFIVAAAIVAAIIWFSSNAPAGTSPLSADAIQGQAPVVVKEVQQEASTSDTNTPEKAKEVIASYYRAIANRDASSLRSLGDTVAATALERGWLDDIGFIVDTAKTDNPDHDGFPAAVGLYAGCPIYRISEFYNMPSNEAIKSDITGLTGVQGWIYYNPMTMSWIIVDPVMPTAVSKSQVDNMQKSSLDNKVTVTVSCPGAYSNPWWCYANIKVVAENNSTDEGSVAYIAPRSGLDSGLTLQVPPELQGELSRATASNVAVVTAGDDGNVSQASTSTVVPNKKEGVCVLYRGTISNFGIDRIGAKAQSMDGNVCPVSVSYGDEEVAPLFPIGKSTLDEVQALYTNKQIERYGATNEAVAIDPNYPTEFGSGDGE